MFSAFSLTDLLVTLITAVRTKDMQHWVLVLPLFHLHRGISKPFEAVPLTKSPKYEASWAGLQGLKIGTPTFTSQERRCSFVC